MAQASPSAGVTKHAHSAQGSQPRWPKLPPAFNLNGTVTACAVHAATVLGAPAGQLSAPTVALSALTSLSAADRRSCHFTPSLYAT